METTRDPRGVPTGDGAGGRTPHAKEQLRMSKTFPDLPEPGDIQTCLLPTGDVAVVTHLRQNSGTMDEPDYGSIYYVHSPEGVEPHGPEAIRELWEDVTDWTPIGREERHLDQAKAGDKSYVQAVSDIQALYRAEVPVAAGEGRQDG